MKQAVIADKISGEIVYWADSKRDGWRILVEHSRELAKTKRHSFYNVKMNNLSWYWVCWEDEAQSLKWLDAPTTHKMVTATDVTTDGKLLFLIPKHCYQYFNIKRNSFYDAVRCKKFRCRKYVFDYVETPEQVMWLRENPHLYARVSGKEKVKEIYPFAYDKIKK